MRVAIAGAHGQIALRLTRLLVARDDIVVGLIRNAAHADDLRAAGAEPVVCDLEQAGPEQIAEAIAGADAAVFAAGAGSGSGADRKFTMDRDGAIKLLDAVIVRPGGLTDEPGTDRVRLDTTPFRGRVTRDDVAAVLAALLPEPRAARRILYVNGGDDAIEDALARILAEPSQV
jgi:nucleoside-diphosphate-sugar epimerase